MQAASEPIGARGRPPARWIVLVAVAAVVGVVLRVWAYRAVLGTPNADEAVVGLMVRHVLDGELTTFYWGQAYGGTQEVLLTAPLFWAFDSSWLALRIVPILLSGIAALLVWRVGLRTIGPTAAAVAGLVFWVWPPFNVFILTHQQGFYASNVVYCALLLLLALRLVERPDRTRAAVFGLVLGLAFWQTAQIVPVAAGIVGWVLWRRRDALRPLWVALPFAVLGALPWLVWNIRHGWGSLVQPDYGDKLESLRLLASPTLPMMVGLRAPFSAELLLPAALTYVVYLGLLALFVVGAVRARGRDVMLLYVVTATFPVVYMLAPKTSLALGTPRFIVVLTPLLALLLAQFATTYRRAAVALALATAISVVTVQRMDDWFTGTPRVTTREEGLGPRHTVQWVPRDLRPLAADLEEREIDRVFAEYWLAYRLAFDTRGRILAVENPFDEVAIENGLALPGRAPEGVRHPPYDRGVRAGPAAFVFYRQFVDEIPIVPALERAGYRRHDVGGYVVYEPPQRVRSASRDG